MKKLYFEPSVSFSNGGNIKTSSWDNLSLREKSEMMRVAVENGVTNLKDIREKYNEFAEGGGFMGLMPIVVPAALRGIGNAVKERAYKTITPQNYNISKAAKEFISGKERDLNSIKPERNEEWARYLGVPYNEESNFEPSPYRPQKGKTYDTVLRFKDESKILSDDTLNEVLDRQRKTGKNSWLVTGNGGGLGTYTLSLGEDEKGKYISYYDDWDINPFKGISARTKIPFISTIEDIVPGSNPFTVYGRRYYEETNSKKHNFGGNLFAPGGELDEEYQYATTYLPEITVTPTRAQKEQAWRNRERNIAKSLVSHPTLPNLFSAAEHYANSIPGLFSAPSEITGVTASEPLLPNVKNAAQLMKAGKVARAIDDAVRNDLKGLEKLAIQTSHNYPRLSDADILDALNEGKLEVYNYYPSKTYKNSLFKQGFTKNDYVNYMSEIDEGLNKANSYGLMPPISGVKGRTITQYNPVNKSQRFRIELNPYGFQSKEDAVYTSIHENEHAAMNNIGLDNMQYVNPITGIPLRNEYPLTFKIMKHNAALIPEVPKEFDNTAAGTQIKNYIKDVSDIDTRVKVTQMAAKRRGMTINEYLDKVPESEMPTNTQELIQTWGKNNPKFRNMLEKWLMFTGGAYVGNETLNE